MIVDLFNYIAEKSGNHMYDALMVVPNCRRNQLLQSYSILSTKYLKFILH